MKEFNDSNFQSEVLNASGVVVVDFFALWCGPCMAMAPNVEGLANEYEGRAVVGKMNIDENPDVPSQLGIMSIPTVLFFKNGQVVDRHVGATSQAVLSSKLAALL